MAGNKESAQKAKATNLAKNPNYYSDMGKLGKTYNGGFASDKVGKDGLTGRQRAALVGPGRDDRKKPE